MRARWALFGLAVAAAGLHALLALGVPGPSLLWDGTAYLSMARWLAGEDTPFLGNLGQYHVGYSLLLVPAALLSSSLDGLFDGVRAVNAMAAGVGAVALAVTARRVFGASPRTALVVGAAGAAYPGFAMQSGLEWTQVVFASGTWGAVLAHHWAFGRPTIRRLIVPVLAVGALYLLHPTGLVLVVATAILFLTLPWRVAAIAELLLGVTTAAAWAVNEWALSELWAPGVPSQSSNLLGNYTDVGLWDDLAARALGSIWYLALASCGLAALGVAALAHHARRGPTATRRTTAWLLLALVGTIALTAGKFAHPARPDHLVYGRYVDGFVPLLVAAGLVHAFTARRRAEVVAAGVAVTAAAGWLVVALADGGAFRGVTMPANLFGVFALDGATAHGIDVATVSVVAAAAAAIVLVVHLGWSRPIVTAAVVLAAFIGGDLLLREDVRAFSLDAQSAFQLGDALDRVIPAGPVALDVAVFDARGANRYRLAAQHHSFTYYDSRRGEEPPHEVVVADKEPAGPAPGARAVFPESNYEPVLWVLPGALQERLAAEGLLLVPAGQPLPSRFFDGEVRLGRARRRSVEVVVRKRGGGAPWLRSDSAPGLAGIVDVEVEVGGRIERARLPRTLFAGETVTVRVPVRLRPGSHRVTARLVEGGTRGFAEIVGNLRIP